MTDLENELKRVPQGMSNIFFPIPTKDKKVNYTSLEITVTSFIFNLSDEDENLTLDPSFS